MRSFPVLATTHKIFTLNSCLRKSQFLSVVFLNFFNSTKITVPYLECWVQSKERAEGSSFAATSTSNLPKKKMALGKVNFDFFDRFLDFLIFLRTTLPNLGFEVQSKLQVSRISSA